MAEIIYHIATTVDNYIADKNGDCPPTLFLYEGDHVSDFLSQIKQYDIVLMGVKLMNTVSNSVSNPGNQATRV